MSFEETIFNIKADSLVHRKKVTQTLGYGAQNRGGSAPSASGGTGGGPRLVNPRRFTDRTTCQLGLIGLQADREKFWNRTFTPTAWSDLRSDGVSFWRFTFYLWRAENQGLRDGYANLVDFIERDVVKVRRSATSTLRTVIEMDGGTYGMEAGQKIRLNSPLSFGPLQIPTSTDVTVNASSGAGIEFTVLLDQPTTVPAVTLWGGWNADVGGTGTSTVRVSIFKCSTSFSPNEQIFLATPVTYSGFTIPANTTITVRATPSVNFDATYIAPGVVDVRLGSTVVDVTATSFRLRLLHNNFFRDSSGTVRYPISTCFNRVSAMNAQGMQVLIGGSHSNVKDAIDTWGLSVVQQIETSYFNYVASLNLRTDMNVLSFENEEVWNYAAGAQSLAERQARWEAYRDGLLTWRMQTARAILPTMTFTYGHPEFKAGRGLEDTVQPINGDLNVFAEAHVYENTEGIKNNPLATQGNYTTVWNFMSQVQSRGLRFLIGEHGTLEANDDLKHQRLGFAAEQARFYEAPLCFWGVDESGYQDALASFSTVGGFWTARLTTSAKAAIFP